MSCKVPIKNGINCEQQWIKSNNFVDTSVKLAGEEAKDRLYEPKHKKKVVRVLTVIAYVFFVSLAAIMLSLYYVFLWNGGQNLGQNKTLPKYQQKHGTQVKCDNIVAEMQQQLSTSTPAIDENSTSPDFNLGPDSEFGETRAFIRKLFYRSPDD